MMKQSLTSLLDRESDCLTVISGVLENNQLINGDIPGTIYITHDTEEGNGKLDNLRAIRIGENITIIDIITHKFIVVPKYYRIILNQSRSILELELNTKGLLSRKNGKMLEDSRNINPADVNILTYKYDKYLNELPIVEDNCEKSITNVLNAVFIVIAIIALLLAMLGLFKHIFL